MTTEFPVTGVVELRMSPQEAAKIRKDAERALNQTTGSGPAPKNAGAAGAVRNAGIAGGAGAGAAAASGAAGAAARTPPASPASKTAAGAVAAVATGTAIGRVVGPMVSRAIRSAMTSVLSRGRRVPSAGAAGIPNPAGVRRVAPDGRAPMIRAAGGGMVRAAGAGGAAAGGGFAVGAVGIATAAIIAPVVTAAVGLALTSFISGLARRRIEGAINMPGASYAPTFSAIQVRREQADIDRAMLVDQIRGKSLERLNESQMRLDRELARTGAALGRVGDTVTKPFVDAAAWYLRLVNDGLGIEENRRERVVQNMVLSQIMQQLRTSAVGNPIPMPGMTP